MHNSQLYIWTKFLRDKKNIYRVANNTFLFESELVCYMDAGGDTRNTASIFPKMICLW